MGLILWLFFQNSTTSLRFQHPCYPQGYEENISTGSFWSGPCAAQERPGPPPGGVRNVTLEGTGDAALCRAAFKNIFDFSTCPYNTSCGFNGVYQPPVNGKFLVGSGLSPIAPMRMFWMFDLLKHTQQEGN